MPIMRFQSLKNPIRSTRKALAAALLAVSFAVCTPHSSYAKPDDSDPDSHYDGRVMGYDPDVELKSGGNGFSWLLVVFMGALCVGVIFKDAKRSHLD